MVKIAANDSSFIFAFLRCFLKKVSNLNWIELKLIRFCSPGPQKKSLKKLLHYLLRFGHENPSNIPLVWRNGQNLQFLRSSYLSSKICVEKRSMQKLLYLNPQHLCKVSDFLEIVTFQIPNVHLKVLTLISRVLELQYKIHRIFMLQVYKNV